jgi:hypothetical protein
MRVLPWLAALLLVASHQAQARGGGHGGVGFHGSVVSRPVVPRFNRGIAVQRSRVNPALAGTARFAQFHQIPNAQPAWGWGGWGWPYAWWPDYRAETGHPPPQPAPVQPEVIVIHTEGNGQTTTQVASREFSYAGCHAIPNGYHCDVPR